MKNVILDTSTLIEFSDFTPNQNFPKRKQEVIDSAIEGLILFDNLSYDLTSVEKIEDYDIDDELDESARNHLKLVLSFLTPIEIEFMEFERMKNNIVSKSKNYLKNNLANLKLYDKKRNVSKDIESLYDEYFISNLYPEDTNFYRNSSHSMLINAPLPEAVTNAFISKKNIDVEYFEDTVVPHLVRIFYYQCLQERTNSHYQPHPSRQIFFGRENKSSIGQKVLDYFNRNTRASFERKKNKFFGIANMTFKIPLLSSYILNNTNSFEEMIDKITQMRNSEETNNFKKGIISLEDALINYRNDEVSEIMNFMERNAKEWQKKLNTEPILREIMPCNPIGSVDERDSPLENILVFVHQLLKGA